VERLRDEEGFELAERGRAEEIRRAAEDERERGERRREAAQAEHRRAVAALGTGLERLASGDLTARIETPFAGDLDALREALNEAVERFAAVLGRVRETSR